jgi:hypothetical protein
MNCQDVPVPTEWARPNPVDIVESWVVAAQSRHLKIGDRLLTTDECQIVEKVLNCILGDLELLK